MDEPPLCSCHGVPQFRNGVDNGNQRYRCRIKDRERQQRYYSDPVWGEQKRQSQRERRRVNGAEQARRYYHARKARGICTRCGGPLLSDVYCWECLNKREERRALRI